MLLEHDASNFEVAITMIQRATNQAMLTITSNSNPGVSAAVLIDFEQEVEEPEEITDLTNTTWNIPAGWTASAGYGQFNVSVQINSDGTPFLYIGYIWGGSDMPSLVSTSNRITGIMGSVTKNNSEAFSITITGGEDVTNPNLIAWLQENGTLQ